MMRPILALAALLLCLVGGPFAASAQTPEEQSRIAWAEARGRLLFEIDRAAWVTTDDLAVRIGDLRNSGITGWTVERDGSGYAVVYYVGQGEARAALYRGRVENNRVVSGQVFAAGSRPPLTAMQRRLADARAAADRLGRQPCTAARFNVAVIPPETPDAPIDVYALTAQVDNDVYPFGGHFRATISPSGEILSQRAFTRDCFNMPSRQNGHSPAALLVTHLLDPIPTEIHVFLSIWTRMPVYVGTSNPRRVWSVEGPHIHLVPTPADARPAT
jgi:hypothetical protein